MNCQESASTTVTRAQAGVAQEVRREDAETDQRGAQQSPAADEDPAQEQRRHHRRDDAGQEHQQVQRAHAEGEAIQAVGHQQAEAELQPDRGQHDQHRAVQRVPEPRVRQQRGVVAETDEVERAAAEIVVEQAQPDRVAQRVQHDRGEHERARHQEQPPASFGSGKRAATAAPDVTCNSRGP